MQKRVAFGKPLANYGRIREDIAQSRIDIEQARLLVLKAAHSIDTTGSKVTTHPHKDHPRCTLQDIADDLLEILITILVLSFQVAKGEIAMIKVVTPNMCLAVVDRAIQALGGKGLTEDTPLSGTLSLHPTPVKCVPIHV